MELQKTAKRKLFSELERTEIGIIQNQDYNGYSIDRYGYFEADLSSLFKDFILELEDNLLTRSPSLIIYLTDIQKSLSGILKNHVQKQRDEIYEIMEHNKELFRENRLGYINHFFNFQKEIIYKTYNEIEQKISIV